MEDGFSVRTAAIPVRNVAMIARETETHVVQTPQGTITRQATRSSGY